MGFETYVNKIIVGRGTLTMFQKEYERINAGTKQFCTASQLFPTGQTAVIGAEPTIPSMIYEYVIYYKVEASAIKLPEEKPKEKKDISPPLAI